MRGPAVVFLGVDGIVDVGEDLEGQRTVSTILDRRLYGCMYVYMYVRPEGNGGDDDDDDWIMRGGRSRKR